MKPRPKALVIDNEPGMRRLVRVLLGHENYRVCEAADGGSGSRLAAERKPDVVILDMGLPDVSGNEWLRSFREWSQTPVLVLSARNQTADKVAALDAGANDYLVKPFDGAELLARLRVLQRCLPGVPEGPFLVEGGLMVNLTAHEVTLDGKRLRFTATEEAVFYLLARHAGNVVTCEHLLRSVWGSDGGKKLHELQVLIARIRKKLEGVGDRVVIRTEGRLGYQLLMGSAHPITGAAENGKGFDTWMRATTLRG